MTVKALVNGEGMTSDGHHHFEQPEQELLLRYCLVFLCPWTLILVYFISSLYQSQSAFRAALCDSFNTPEAINVLRDPLSKSNVYINSRGNLKAMNVRLVENIAQWTGKMLRMFGLGEGEKSELGWGQLDESGGKRM